MDEISDEELFKLVVAADDEAFLSADLPTKRSL
jgi:hypothetical protein